VDRLADDAGDQQEEADRDHLLRGPLGGGADQAGFVARQVTMMDVMALVPLSGPNPGSPTDPTAVAVPIASGRGCPSRRVTAVQEPVLRRLTYTASVGIRRRYLCGAPGPPLFSRRPGPVIVLPLITLAVSARPFIMR